MAHSLGFLWGWDEFLNCLWPVTSSGPLLVACGSLSQDGIQREGSSGGRMVKYMDWSLPCPSDLTQVLLVGGSLLVPGFLLGPPVIK